jgi:hypothetical protein
MTPPEPQLSATTHWTVNPLSAKQQERVARTNRLKPKLWMGMGGLLLLCGVVAWLWLLTAYTVTATATQCSAPHEHHSHLVSKCTMSWTDGGRTRSLTQTLDQPGALSSRDQLAVDGLGISGGLHARNAKLIAGMLSGAGTLWLVLGLLFRHIDKRSGRTASQLGR